MRGYAKPATPNPSGAKGLGVRGGLKPATVLKVVGSTGPPAPNASDTKGLEADGSL